MRFRWLALPVVVLALGLMPREGKAQGTARKHVIEVQQNYPNPFNPETHQVFGFDLASCAPGGPLSRVSVTIYNLLMQRVAVPVLQGGAGSVAGGQPLQNVSLPCGQYTWYWNGNYQGTSKEAASGVYIVIVDVDGQKTTKRIMNAK
ncbi:MAG: T9SS type A sorting domain-containing protein [Gemmatimonadales bacterium]